MKLSVNFDALLAATNLMGARDRAFTLKTTLPPLEEIDTQLKEGIVVNINEIKKIEHGLLSFKDRQVLLYIQDHDIKIIEALDDGALGKKYHVAYCITLEEMQSKGRYNRYVAKNNIDGIFLIDGKNEETNEYIKGTTNLKVCKNCLKHLDYKGYESNISIKKEIFDTFSLEEFFKAYQQLFKHKPKYKAGQNQSPYVNNWPEISNNYKRSVNWVCENCNVDLTQNPELIHTHHLNGVKHDNTLSNFKALCCECHANEPDHGHMDISYQQKTQLINLRLSQTASAEIAKSAMRQSFGSIPHNKLPADNTVRCTDNSDD
ncbi:MAG: hypothetical protein KAH18_03180 [Psychromonas sp.]|nr:hypothetical protein [Psychromonas sp.]